MVQLWCTHLSSLLDVGMSELTLHKMECLVRTTPQILKFCLLTYCPLSIRPLMPSPDSHLPGCSTGATDTPLLQPHLRAKRCHKISSEITSSGLGLILPTRLLTLPQGVLALNLRREVVVSKPRWETTSATATRAPSSRSRVSLSSVLLPVQ